MKGTIEVKTDQLLLRQYRIKDIQVLYEKFGKESRMYEYSGWNPYASIEMTRDTVCQFIDSYQDPHFYGWAIEYLGNLIGTIGAYDYDETLNQIEIGISIEPHYWGQGFASEAVIKVIDYLMNEEDIHTITAWCASDNIGSRKVLEKVGMHIDSIDKNALHVDTKTYDKINYSISK